MTATAIISSSGLLCIWMVRYVLFIVIVAATAAVQTEKTTLLPLDNAVGSSFGKEARTVADWSFPDMTIHKIAFGSCHKRKYAIRLDDTTGDDEDEKELKAPSRNVWYNIAGKASTKKQDILDDAAVVGQPDVFIWTGDAIYPPSQAYAVASVEELRQEYSRLRHDPTLGYTALQPPGGIWGVWDDHDYGANDAGVEIPDKPARAHAFYEFLGKHPQQQQQPKLPPHEHIDPQSKAAFARSDQLPPAVANRQGLYYSVTWGDVVRTETASSTSTTTNQGQVKMIVLDTRWHRTPHCIPSVALKIPILGAGLACVTRWLSAGLFHGWCRRQQEQPLDENGGAATTTAATTLLGTEQWSWLDHELHSSNADLYIIVSSIQVWATNPVFESWGHFPAERDRLSRHLLRKLHGSDGDTAGAVVVLSGDVHFAELIDPVQHHPISPYRRNANDHLLLLEVTSSGLTHHCGRGLYGKFCRPLTQLFSKHRFETADNVYIGANYGSITIDWQRHQFAVNIHSAESGQVVLATGPLLLPESLLQHRQASYNPESEATFSNASVEEDLAHIFPCMDGHLIPILQTAMLVMIMFYWFLRSVWSHPKAAAASAIKKNQ